MNEQIIYPQKNDRV